MPVKPTTVDGKPAFKWGDKGHAYAYTAGDEKSKDRAKRQAVRQGMAINSREDGVVKVMKAYSGNGVMIALPLPTAIAEALGPRETSPDEMHVTLAYLGKKDAVSPDVVQRAMEVARDVAGSFRPMRARIGGHGRFVASESSDGRDVMYASYDAPMLNDFRHALLLELRAAGIPLKGLAHGFTPHVTTDYVAPGQVIDPPSMPPDEFDVPAVCLYVGDMRIEMPFGGDDSYRDQADDAEPAEGQDDVNPMDLQPADVIALKMFNLTLVTKERKAPVSVLIAKADGEGMEQLVYGVVLEPDMVDADNQTMTPEDVKFAAHYFMTVQGITGFRHREQADADVVESYLAPCDFTLGNQEVKQGSWVMVTRVNDPALWQQILDGEITGYSVGGFGVEVDPVTGEPIPPEPLAS